MEKVNITGWNGFYLNKKELIIAIASTVKIYSKELNLIKKFDSIKYATTLSVDSNQSKLYVATTTNLLYCIDLDTLEISWRHRIAIDKWKENQLEICSMQLSKDEDCMFVLAMELGRNLVVKHDFEEDETGILCTDQTFRCPFNNEIYSINSKIVLLEDKCVISAGRKDDACLSRSFVLEEQQLDNVLQVTWYKLRNERKQPVAVLDVCDGYYLIEECKDILSILDKHLKRIFTVEKSMIDGNRLKFDPVNNLLAISVFCAKPANLLLLKIEKGVIKAMQYERAYDCIFREDDVILLADRGKSKLLRHEELFVTK